MVQLVENEPIISLTPEWTRVYQLAHINDRLFENVFSVSIIEEAELRGKDLSLNGRPVEVTMVCFQANFEDQRGLVRFHQEGVEEGREGEYEVFWPTGGDGGDMIVVAEGISDEDELDCVFAPVLTTVEASKAKYELAIAANMKTKREFFQINITTEDGRVLQPTGVETPPGGLHSTKYGVKDVLCGIALKYRYLDEVRG